MSSISGAIKCLRKELDLGITLNGGQSFRWSKITTNESERFQGVFKGTVWTLWQDEDSLNYIVHGSIHKDANFDELLHNYFQLDFSLQENLEKWAKADSHFQLVHKQIGAVRILNQDVVENLFSFICSSNNNIIRISGMVEKLCKNFGNKICEIDKKEYFDFPTIEALCDSNVESVLRKEGFGYRAGYIHKSAQKLIGLGGKNWLLEANKNNGSSYENAKTKLMELPGIGPKVADCICLMSLGHLEAIPVDTHIYQVACKSYMPHLSQKKSFTTKMYQEINSYFRELWGPLAGWAQTVIFCVKISSVDKSHSKKRCSVSSNKDSRIEGKKKRKSVS